MDNKHRPTVKHMEFCSMLCVNLDGREHWGKMETCIYMAKSFVVHLKLSQHYLLIRHIPVQNKSQKKKANKPKRIQDSKDWISNGKILVFFKFYLRLKVLFQL